MSSTERTTSRPRSVFRACRFDGADLRRASPGQSRFEACTFEGSLIDEWSVATAEFIDCRFTGRIAGVTFHGKPWGRGATSLDPARTVNEFRGNDFTGADLRECAFIRGIALDQQRWPEGDTYVRLDRFHQRLARARPSSPGATWRRAARRWTSFREPRSCTGSRTT